MVKFLVVRFSSIGDIVLTTPVVRCLKTQVKDAEVHYLVKKQYESVIKANPYIDKVYSLEGSLNKLAKKLKTENYHYIIDLHKNIRTFSLKLQLGILTFTFNKLNYKKWLLVNFKINKLPDIHIVDRYFKSVRLFDVRNDNKGLDYNITDGDKIDINSLNSELINGYIAFALGARHFTKQLPDDKIIALCSKINYPVVLLGGKEDFDKGEKIKDTTGTRVYNYCGKLSINQSASIIKQAKLVISHDTGMMHIAAAFRKKIISIWGNTVPEFGMYPYLPGKDSQIIQIHGLSCRPCSKLGYKKCPRGHFRCMRDINENDVANVVNTSL
ncbi:MAG: glycosyltransferase family 9 protein [Bacteroidales bacterium]|nr:MAG: glycosyltransferase family 9 protein [Bacteroidales bacterium]